MSPWILHQGLGPGGRLMCMGLPDAISIVGSTVVWTVDGGLFVQDGERALFFPAEEVLGIAVDSGRCAFACADTEGFRIVQILDGQIQTERIYRGRGIEIGLDVVVVDSGTDRIAYRVSTNDALPLPVGARDSRPKPFSSGVGAIWLDGPKIFRVRETGRPKSAGALPEVPQRWVAGPQGSALFETDAGVWALSSSSGLAFVGELDFETVRVCSEGLFLLAQSENGVVEVDMSDGSVRSRKQAPLVPVGFGPEPIVLDEDGGLLRTIAGRVLAEGCLPSAVTTSDLAIYGPGGTAWSRKTGEKLWNHAPLCGEHLAANGSGVVQIAERIEGFDSDGQLVVDLPLPINLELDGEVIDFHTSDGLMYFLVQGGWIAVNFNGRRVEAGPPQETNDLDTESICGWAHDAGNRRLRGPYGDCPLPVDGCAPLEDGRLFVWTEDGMGVVFDPEQPPLLNGH